MAAKRRKKHMLMRALITIVLIVGAFIFAFTNDTMRGYLIDLGILQNATRTPENAEGQIKVHFIDVGQGDSILITAPDGNLLIDAGTNSSEDELKNYLNNHGIKKLEYVVFTHPHEDHIGGADMIMTDFEVNNVIMPSVVQTTVVYERMITAIEDSKATVHEAKSGDTYSIGDLKMKVLAPCKDKYSEINDYSVVMRVDFGEVSFMMTGDAEVLSEEEIMEKYPSSELKCNLLKLGHHGSTSSTGDDFLAAVSPDMAIISCGEGNTYGHPHREIIERLKKAEITYYRTDEVGSIVFVCDGKNLVKE